MCHNLDNYNIDLKIYIYIGIRYIYIAQHWITRNIYWIIIARTISHEIYMIIEISIKLVSRYKFSPTLWEYIDRKVEHEDLDILYVVYWIHNSSPWFRWTFFVLFCFRYSTGVDCQKKKKKRSSNNVRKNNNILNIY
jgi:hypothetical protein